MIIAPKTIISDLRVHVLSTNTNSLKRLAHKAKSLSADFSTAGAMTSSNQLFSSQQRIANVYVQPIPPTTTMGGRAMKHAGLSVTARFFGFLAAVAGGCVAGGFRHCRQRIQGSLRRHHSHRLQLQLRLARGNHLACRSHNISDGFRGKEATFFFSSQLGSWQPSGTSGIAGAPSTSTILTASLEQTWRASTTPLVSNMRAIR